MSVRDRLTAVESALNKLQTAHDATMASGQEGSLILSEGEQQATIAALQFATVVLEAFDDKPAPEAR
jgi:transcriptional regulator NrdR family protein